MDEKTIERYRTLFPVTQKYIYLDHAGVAPMSLSVTTAIGRFLQESTTAGAFPYPSWAQRVEEVRRSCAKLINADADEIAFVKSTSHGLSLVASGLDWKPVDNVLVFEKEFPSNLYPWMRLQTQGVEVRRIPSKNGGISIEDIERLLDRRTRLVALSSVQFSNGFRADLKAIGDLCASRKVLFCVDAIQGLGVIPMDVERFNIDFLSADAHKWLLGPEGIGLFFARRELAQLLDPPLIGWKSVQNEFDFDAPDLRLKTDALRFEEGSQNLMGIIGLGAAVDLLLEIGVANIEQRVLDLGEVIRRESGARGFAVMTPAAREERGGNITIAVPSEPAATRDALRANGIMVNARGGGLRISPHFYNTENEVLTFFSTLDRLLEKSDG